MRTLSYDLRFAFRQLRKTPGMALLAILTLALGIGANAAIFTVVESVLLRPLPYSAAKQLVFIGSARTGPGFSNTSWMNYSDVRTQSRQLDAVAGYSEDASVVETPEESVSVAAPRVTANLFSMLGAQPLLGRTFTASEGESNGPPVVIISEGLWRGTFHSDPGIVGRSVRIGGQARTVVGVMPMAFHFPESMGADIEKGLWLPLQPTTEMLKDRGYDFFLVLGRLRAGATLSQLQQELSAIASRIPHDEDGSVTTLEAAFYQELLTGSVRPVLFGLFAALGLVLLIACANVSNLLIARCLARRQEFAVRSALGAPRARLMRQLLAEGFTLSFMGCVVGVLLAELAIAAVHKLPDGTIPRPDAISIHWTMVLALAAIAAVTTILSSLLPGVLVARSNPQAALQAASRGLGSRSVGGRISGILVAGEVALSTLLLVGAGLLFRTIWNLEKAQLGFETVHLTTFTAMPADAAGFSQLAVSTDTGHAPPSVASLVYRPVLDRIRQSPGVESAALVTSLPLGGMQLGSSFKVLGEKQDPENKWQTQMTAISGDYARTFGTPIIRGRMIEDSDTASTQLVVVINQALAKKYFAGKDPIGKQLDLGGKDTGMLQPYSIVGVMGDQATRSIGAPATPFLMIPQEQIPTTSLYYPALLKTIVSFVVKTRGDIPIAPQMRAVFHSAAPGYALDDFQTMQETVDKSTFSQRLGLYLVGSFAGLAIAMVIAGLYGVLSQLVSYRRREIGVRMALGATRTSVAQLVLRQGSVLIGAGLVLGLLLAFATGRLVKSFLFEVKPTDIATYLSVAVALILVGLIAALIPARKAASIQPMQALRED